MRGQPDVESAYPALARRIAEDVRFGEPHLVEIWSWMDWSERLLGLTVIGYLVGARGFAELHLPGLPLYIGEIVLIVAAVALLCDAQRRLLLPKVCGVLGCGMALTCLVTSLSRLTMDPMNTLRDSATFYYLFFFVAAWSPRGNWIAVFVYQVVVKSAPIIVALIAAQALMPERMQGLLCLPGHEYGLLFCTVNVWPTNALLVALLASVRAPHPMDTRHWVRACCAACALLLIAMSPQRGPTLGAIVAVATCLLLRGAPLLPRTLLATALVGCAAAVLLNATELPNAVVPVDRFAAKVLSLIDYRAGDEFKGGAVASADFRIEWWKDAVNANLIDAHTFLFGQGFGANAGSIGSRFDPSTSVRGAHSAWINYFWWNGIAGLTLYVVALVLPALVILRSLLSREVAEHRPFRSLRIVIFGWYVGILATASFDNVLSNPVVCIPTFTLMGSALSIAGYRGGARVRRRSQAAVTWGRTRDS